MWHSWRAERENAMWWRKIVAQILSALATVKGAQNP
jgi:hypothetical protein